MLWWIIPFGGWISYPLLLLSTFAHELGHGLAALSVGHGFESMKINFDGSGVTYSSSVGGGSRLANAWISAGGLIGPAIAAAGLFSLGRNARTSKMSLGLIGAGMLLIDILFVRNLFGFFFVGFFGLAFLFIAAKGGIELSRFVVIFVATQLALSVFSRSDYLFTRSANVGASDVAQMAEALWLPYWFWGIVCGGFSVLILVFGIRQYVRK
jgi:hypothetical protein